jgi:hypothetical protein
VEVPAEHPLRRLQVCRGGPRSRTVYPTYRRR